MQWPPKAGTRVEAHEAEGLGLGGVEDVPDVDVHLLEDHLELVDEGDVDAPEDVLDELAGLGGAGVLDADGGVEDFGVEGLCEIT